MNPKKLFFEKGQGVRTTPLALQYALAVLLRVIRHPRNQPRVHHVPCSSPSCNHIEASKVVPRDLLLAVLLRVILMPTLKVVLATSSLAVLLRVIGQAIPTRKSERDSACSSLSCNLHWCKDVFSYESALAVLFRVIISLHNSSESFGASLAVLFRVIRISNSP